MQKKKKIKHKNVKIDIKVCPNRCDRTDAACKPGVINISNFISAEVDYKS